MTRPLTGLMEVAREALERTRSDLARHGLVLDPVTKVAPADGLLSWYDTADRQIYLSLPDVTQPLGMLQSLFFRQMLGCQDDAELDRLIRLVLPWLMAHEAGHALRHQAGRFGDDPWLEEQIANQFASALTRRRTLPRHQEDMLELLRRAVKHLRGQLGTDLATESHGDAHHALGVAGVLRRGTVRSLETIETIFALAPERVLRETHGLSAELVGLLDRREDTIQAFKEQYASSALRYAAFQLGWMVIAWEGAEQHLLEELAERHLGRAPLRLPELGDEPPTEARVRACASAWRTLSATSHPLAPWFYKRYRERLLGLVAASGQVVGGEFDREEQRVAEERDEDEPGTLDMLVGVAPPALQGLFPARLATSASSLEGLGPVERALYDAALGLPAPPAAGETARGLIVLLGSPFYGGLPAALLFELAQLALPLHLDVGEGLTSQGAIDDDVYLVVAGSLEILVSGGPDEDPVPLGTLGAGEVVGEVAFLSGEPRSATLVALEPTECLVLRAHTMRLLGYAHPELLLRLARLLARRLVDANQRRV